MAFIKIVNMKSAISLIFVLLVAEKWKYSLNVPNIMVFWVDIIRNVVILLSHW